jgi:GNAT superfamily N-acetyltransferase
MDDRRGITWYLLNGTMELIWFLGWAMFSSLLVSHRPFPFYETVAAFSLACLTTRAVTGRGWRVAAVLSIELAGLSCGALLLLHGIYFDAFPLFASGWFILFYNVSRTTMEWFILALNILLIVILLAGGIALARRPRGYFTACNRFDFGVAAFFALFLIKLAALTKGESLAEDNLSLLFVFPFFLAGLLSIALSRRWGNAAGTFLPGHRTTGVIAVFFAAVLAGVSLMLLFFMPGLIAAARLGKQALTAAGKPLIPVLVSILRFIFGPHGGNPMAAAGKSSPFSDTATRVADQPGWWTALLEKIMVWGVGGILLAAVAGALIVTLFYTVKWLLSRTGSDIHQTTAPFLRFSALIARLRVLLRRIFLSFQGYGNASDLYQALLQWGRRSGLPHLRHETPAEFGFRLQRAFPGMTPAIQNIITAYNREAYREEKLDSALLAVVNDSWRALRHPRLWPARLKRQLSGTSSD